MKHSDSALEGPELPTTVSRCLIDGHVQVVENKVHTYVSTHGPKLKEISQQARAQSAVPFRDRSNSPPPQTTPTRSSNTRRGSSASGVSRSSLAPGALAPHARVPGRIPGLEERVGGGSASQAGYVGPGPKRPCTAGATVQSSPIKSPADALVQSLLENTSPQRRARYVQHLTSILTSSTVLALNIKRL